MSEVPSNPAIVRLLLPLIPIPIPKVNLLCHPLRLVLMDSSSSSVVSMFLGTSIHRMMVDLVKKGPQIPELGFKCSLAISLLRWGQRSAVKLIANYRSWSLIIFLGGGNSILKRYKNDSIKRINPDHNHSSSCLAYHLPFLIFIERVILYSHVTVYRCVYVCI